MNDHNSELPQDGYAANIDDIDNINHYYQQTQEFQDLKLQEELVKQHYGSPTGSPQQQFTPSGPAAIGPVYDGVGELGELGELEKLSHTYSPVYTVKAIQSEKTPLITRPIADSVMKGPLVGELRSIKELGVEYVDADPVYVVKTAASSLHHPLITFKSVTDLLRPFIPDTPTTERYGGMEIVHGEVCLARIHRENFWL